MVKITLSNDFHNSHVTKNLYITDIVTNYITIDISSKVMKSIWKKLCSNENCQCGGVRGKQEILIFNNKKYKFSHIIEKGEKYQIVYGENK